MGETTGIEWAQATWNPWQGCHKVSQGCKNCYMYRDKARYGQDPATVVRSSPHTFNMPLRLKEPSRIFTCSWSDWFIEEADPWRDEAWDIVRRTPQHTYMILTKRPERFEGHLPAGWPFPNVILGVSAERQKEADARIPILLHTPAAKRMLSLEPLLGPIDLCMLASIGGGWFNDRMDPQAMIHDMGWIIVGGESGPDARPMHPDWVRRIQSDAAYGGIPFHFKQWGEWRPPLEGERYSTAMGRAQTIPTFIVCQDTGNVHCFQNNYTVNGKVMRRVGKKAAGRLLDGRTWDEFPEMPQVREQGLLPL